MPQLTSRLIRWQHGPSPRNLNHLVTCYDDPDRSYHVASGPTLCGRIIVRPGDGGWGHGPKDCPACWALGAPAERLR